MAERVVVPLNRRAARLAYVAAGIKPAIGADAFARALAAELPQVVISPYEVGRILATMRASSLLPQNGALAAADLAIATETEPGMASVGYQSPEGDVEVALAELWKSLLGVPAIDVQANFFEMGGHSLIATRILARVDEQFGVRLPLRTIFDAPTIRQFAEVLAAQGERRPVHSAVDETLSGDREEFEL